MRGQSLAPASLSRNYRLKTGFALICVKWPWPGRLSLPGMKRRGPPKSRLCVAALGAFIGLWATSQALAQDQAPPQGTSRGENFSANKPPAQLFASDCTGAGCHKGPQGLGKGQMQGMLASFLREHYTNSRESAASLAGYLSGIPSGPPREARTPPSPPRPSKPVGTAAAAPVPGPSGSSWSEGIIANEPKPPPSEARTPRQTPGGRTSRAAARPDDEPAATPPAPPVAAPPSAHVAPIEPRTPRGRQPAATAAAPPSPDSDFTPAAVPSPPPPASKPKQFDIFD
jgi:hypothetical protein